MSKKTTKQTIRVEPVIPPEDKGALMLLCALALAGNSKFDSAKDIIEEAKELAGLLIEEKEKLQGEEDDGSDSDDSETDDDSDSENDEDDADNEDEDDDSDESEDEEEDGDEGNDSDADEDDEEDKPKKKASKKSPPSTGGSKAGKAKKPEAKTAGKKKFKSKPQGYARDNDTHKEIFSGVLKAVAPNWKKDAASKKRAKDVSVKLEGAEFLDVDGNVLAAFKQSVKKAMSVKK